jgi:hypothetical protein
MLADAALVVALSVEHGSGTSACLEARALEKAVERRLKRQVFVAKERADLALRVVFTKADDRFDARIELASQDGAPRGTRTLSTASHCSALDDSLALSVALLVDEPPDPEPVSAPTPNDTAPSKPLAPAPKVIEIPPEVAAPREPWHARFGASAQAAWGILPGVRPALTLHLTIVPHGFWPIELQGEGFWPTNADRNANSGARFHLFRVGLALCPELSSGPSYAFGVCVGQRLSWITVEGYGFDHDLKEKRLGYSLSLGAEGRVRLFGPVSSRAYLGLGVPLVRDRFTSGGRAATELFQPAPAAIFGQIGLEASLW